MNDKSTQEQSGKKKKSWKMGCLTTFVIIFIIGAIGSLFDDKDKSSISNTSKSSISNTSKPNVESKYHPLQIQFEKERAALKTEYEFAKNEIKKSAVFNKSRKRTCDFVNAHGSNFTNWYGKLTYLSTDQGGDKVSITITSNYHNLEVQYEDFGIKMGSSVYNQVAELVKGDYVYINFTPKSAGAINSTERECFDENSFTESGSLDAPEFSVNISRIDLTKEAERKRLRSETQKSTAKSSPEVAKPIVEEWVGTFSGVCPEYNMKNKYGENLIIMGNYVIIPSVKYTFEIYDNNVSSIYMKSEDGNYSCHNVIYSVSSNNNNFSLTMKPQSGSDCGGNEIIFIKSGSQFKIAAEANGQPGFILNKTN